MGRINLVFAVAMITAVAPAGAQQQSTAHGPAVPSGVTTRSQQPSTIRGTALNSFSSPLPQKPVRLRDTRAGRVVDLQITDAAGMFTFAAVAPGSYIVELVGSDKSVLAASEMIVVDAGDSVTTVVKLPFRVPPAAGIARHSPSAVIAIIGEAVAAGVLATTVAGSAISPVIP